MDVGLRAIAGLRVLGLWRVEKGRPGHSRARYGARCSPSVARDRPRAQTQRAPLGARAPPAARMCDRAPLLGVSSDPPLSARTGPAIAPLWPPEPLGDQAHPAAFVNINLTHSQCGAVVVVVVVVVFYCYSDVAREGYLARLLFPGYPQG